MITRLANRNKVIEMRKKIYLDARVIRGKVYPPLGFVYLVMLFITYLLEC